ncbi:hypothetical protein MCOR27_004373 [Pyricularia oryzae]|uniref:C2H2-type domain-containing protein n=1 Tax=Pyricularia grisea TaxID=148305 RepID=A0ABQ8NH74_PYRGI|nr:hypothetical protein MCOR01_006504 [Pyricularia oryzae]KAI6296949.1 hypothetical protein MCOR33_006573 [Pyricularia grisea]KAH9435853.1 hypothetical protein MCOR02_004769 [Pyricularia oryzae]KAI6260922.1 hypothetical protein MCOR19_002791 [Pyricularia oryzae]KAI6280229.1 hypothetical protein MCOR26_003822 [Pyricularia oryzae]
MGKGVDGLVEWCVREISFADDEGLTPQKFVLVVKRYLEDADNKNEATAKSGAVIENTANLDVDHLDPVDVEIAAPVWHDVAARAEIFVGSSRSDKTWNHLPFESIYELPDTPKDAAQSDTIVHAGKDDLPNFQPRIFTSEELTWINITGHGIDFLKIPPLCWKLLPKLASCHYEGCSQGNLCKMGGGDIRSVPKRTDKLAEQGYIVKRTVVLRGSKTSKLWLTQFAPPDLPSAENPNTWGRDLDLSRDHLTKSLRPVPWCHLWTGVTIEYESFGRTAIAVIRAWEVMRIADLKNKLGIHGVRWQMKVLARMLRRFASAGITKYVAAKLGETGKVFKDCVKYVREPTDDEWEKYLSTGGGKAQYTKAGKKGNKSVEPKIPTGGPKPVVSAQLSKWSPERPLVNLVYDTIKRSAFQGLTGPQVSTLTVGYAFRRYMDSLMPVLSKSEIQPGHLGHLTIRPENRGPRSRVFTTEPSDGPEIAPGTLSATIAGTLEPAAALEAFGFGPILETLAATPANATLTSLARITNDYGEQTRMMKPLSIHSENVILAQAEGSTSEHLAKKARLENVPQVEEEIEALNATVPPGVGLQDAGASQDEIDQADLEEHTRESKKRSRPLERRPDIEPGARAFIAQEDERPKKKGRPSKNPVMPIIIKFVGQSVQRWQVSAGFELSESSLATDDEDRDIEPSDEEESDEEIPAPYLTMEARYNGRPGQLKVSSSEQTVVFEYGGKAASKPSLQITIASIVDNPSIDTPPDDDDKCLVINATRNNSRWPYIFHFDNTAEVCEAATALRDQVESLRMGTVIKKKAKKPKKPKNSGKAANGIKRKWKAEGYKCDRCGSVYKNDNGLKYHQEKSQTPCNPDFDPKVMAEKPDKRRRSHVDGNEDQGTPAGRGQRSARLQLKKPNHEPEQPSNAFGRKISKRPESGFATRRGIGSLEKGAIEEAPLVLGQSLPTEPDVSMVDSPAIGRSDIPTNDIIMIENPQPLRVDEVVTEEAPVEAVEQSSPAEAASMDQQESAADQVSASEDSNGFPKFVLPPLTNPKLLESSHRTISVIQYLVDVHDGVFPGDKAMWYAVYTMHEKEFPQEIHPSFRSCLAIIKTMERRGWLRTYAYAWRDEKGSTSKLYLAIKEGVPDSSPKIATMKERIQAAHPLPYVPPGFEPSPETLDALHARLADESSRMHSRASRRKQVEVEVLKAPFYEETRSDRLAKQESPARRTHVSAFRPSPIQNTRSFPPGDRSELLRSRLKASLAQPRQPKRRSLFESSNPGLDSLPPHFFNGTIALHDGGVALPLDSSGGGISEASAPISDPFLRQRLPGSVDEIPHNAPHSDDEWADPHWARFTWHVNACREWEQADETSQLLQSSTLAPEYCFLNFTVDPGAFEGVDSPSLQWFAADQFNILDLPYKILARDVYRYERQGAYRLTIPRGPRGPYRPRGSNAGGPSNVRGGPLGVRGTSNLRASAGNDQNWSDSDIMAIPSAEPTVFATPLPLQFEPPALTPAPTRVPVFRKVRELTAFPHTPEDYSAQELVEVDDDVDWSAENTKLAAFIAIRVLLGGVEKVIDWGLMMRLFPDVKLSALRKFWGHMRKTRSFYIEATTELFQDNFLEAYEEGELPPLNYDDVLAYDWRRLIRWTLNEMIEQDIVLPATKEGLEQEYVVDDNAYTVPEWRDTYFHYQRSIWNRFQDFTSEVAAMPAKPQLTNYSSLESIITSWIRALCSTPPEFYSPGSIRDRVYSLGVRDDHEVSCLLQGAMIDLQRRRVIKKSKPAALKSGRPYKYTQFFYTTLDKYSQPHKFSQAAIFKAHLDSLFRQGKILERLDFTVDDGAIMAIVNLQAHGRIKVEPIDIPNIPFGFDPGNYETRKYNKDFYQFSVRVLPTDKYVYNEDIPLLDRVRTSTPPGMGLNGQLPTWCDFLGTIDWSRWARFVSAVFFILATRGSMGPERASAALGPLTEPYDVQCIMDWGVRLGLLREMVAGGGVCVNDWWWLGMSKLTIDEEVSDGEDTT